MILTPPITAKTKVFVTNINPESHRVQVWHWSRPAEEYNWEQIKSFLSLEKVPKLLKNTLWTLSQPPPLSPDSLKDSRPAQGFSLALVSALVLSSSCVISVASQIVFSRLCMSKKSSEHTPLAAKEGVGHV